MLDPQIGEGEQSPLVSGSRPPETNCKEGTGGASEASPPAEKGRLLWASKRRKIVNEFVERMPERAERPISVIGETKLREEATMSSDYRDGNYSRSWSRVLDEFLRWYNGYRFAHLVFENPEGNLVRSQMRNSHQPDYSNKYYAKLKALERQMVEDFDNPYTVMLSLTGSSKNDHGRWRCPGDHLRDVIETWRPSEGSGVYHDLRYTLGEKLGLDWEYAIVVEPHKSGYGHVHVALFIDGKVQKSDFHSAIDKHLQHCDSASPEAHNYYSSNPRMNPISVNKVDPTISIDDLDDQEDTSTITNLGSYIGEYIGMDDTDVFKREPKELAFRAVMWATQSQTIRFSTGANEMINKNKNSKDKTETEQETKMALNPDFDIENPTDEPQWLIEEGSWNVVAVGRVDESGEDLYDVQNGVVDMVEIEDSSHLDPPQKIPFSRPTKETEQQQLK